MFKSSFQKGLAATAASAWQRQGLRKYGTGNGPFSPWDPWPGGETFAPTDTGGDTGGAATWVQRSVWCCLWCCLLDANRLWRDSWASRALRKGRKEWRSTYETTSDSGVIRNLRNHVKCSQGQKGAKQFEEIWVFCKRWEGRSWSPIPSLWSNFFTRWRSGLSSENPSPNQIRSDLSSLLFSNQRALASSGKLSQQLWAKNDVECWHR